MSETIGGGKIDSTCMNTNKVWTFEITVFDTPGTNPPPTPAAVEQLLISFKTQAAAQGLTIKIKKSQSDIV